MGQTRIKKGRAIRPVRRMGTEVHDDTRTQRERQRGQAERAAIEAELRELDDLLGEIDTILAEQARTEAEIQDFLDGFMQRGGE